LREKMARYPTVAHQVIVDYILSGHTTQDARDYFGFKSDNIANLRVHAAFKALCIPRPRYQDSRACEFCGKQFVARDRFQRTCGAVECQNALIRDWQKNNPESSKSALRKYRATEKGRQNNLRMHRQRRRRGLIGTPMDRWNFAATEIKKSLRKLTYLATRNPWEYRVQHIQRVAQMHREFSPRPHRKFTSDVPANKWQQAIRAMQTIHCQMVHASVASSWERAANSIANALRTGHKVREWKQNQLEK
jgi:hypothetical protein